MKNYLTLISMLILLAAAVYAQELTELVRLYGPEEGSGFYHICAPGDVNGDGYDDFIISSPTRDRNVRECENGYARLYFGSNPIDTSNYITIPAVCNEYQTPYDNLFGYHSAKVGDINNDGYPDFLIGDPGYFNYGTERAGAGFVYFGGVAIDTLPSWQLVGDWWNGRTYYYGTGDVNGDNYNDVVMGITDHYILMPSYLFLGGESPDTLYDFELGPYHPDSSYFSRPTIIGDYNGDGLDDIFVSDPEYPCGSGHGIACMYFGSDTGFDEPDLIFEHRGGWNFGMMSCGTDWNNDGCTDLFIACSQDTVFGYYGSQDPDATCDVIFTSEPWNFGEHISGGGDLNRDGYPELAISNDGWTGEHSAQGRVLIYYGGVQPDTIPDVIVYGTEVGQFFGKETAFPGDIDGDGYQEFISSSFFQFDQSRAFVTIFTTRNVSVPDDGQVPNDYDFKFTSYPNPFNTTTTISFDLPVSVNARLEVYNLIGQKIATLVEGCIKAGNHSIQWEAAGYSSGIYFYKLTAGDRVITKRTTLLK
jgi:hypothetical protein